jgi:hypothetical protein
MYVLPSVVQEVSFGSGALGIIDNNNNNNNNNNSN